MDARRGFLDERDVGGDAAVKEFLGVRACFRRLRDRCCLAGLW